jgi:hypothetical protein
MRKIFTTNTLARLKNFSHSLFRPQIISKFCYLIKAILCLNSSDLRRKDFVSSPKTKSGGEGVRKGVFNLFFFKGKPSTSRQASEKTIVLKYYKTKPGTTNEDAKIVWDMMMFKKQFPEQYLEECSLDSFVGEETKFIRQVFV